MATRSSVDVALGSLCGGYLATVKTPTTPSGEPPRVVAYDIPIALALIQCGITLADPTNPSDAELDRLPLTSWTKFLDLAELRVLETAAATLSSRDFRREFPDIKLERDAKGLLDALKLKRDLVRQAYGVGGPILTAGVVRVRPRRKGPEF